MNRARAISSPSHHRSADGPADGRDAFHSVPDLARARLDRNRADSAFAAQPCPQFDQPRPAYADEGPQRATQAGQIRDAVERVPTTPNTDPRSVGADPGVRGLTSAATRGGPFMRSGHVRNPDASWSLEPGCFCAVDEDEDEDEDERPFMEGGDLPGSDASRADEAERPRVGVEDEGGGRGRTRSRERATGSRALEKPAC
jgi:hypothetical protein